MRTRVSDGDITDTVHFQHGLSLRADPELNVGGQYHSPSGRLLELDVTCAGPGKWLALHISLGVTELTDCAWVGLTCRQAATAEQLIRPCLRSGTDTGFVDCFFDKHMLAVPEPRNHVDVLHIETRPDLPETALWRELVLFLPTRDFRWDMHDLRLFII